MSTHHRLHCRVDGADSGYSTSAAQWLATLLAHRAAIVACALVVDALELEITTWRFFDGEDNAQTGDIANPVRFLMVHGAHGEDAVVVEDEYGYRYDAQGEPLSLEESAALDAQEQAERQARTETPPADDALWSTEW